MQIQLKPEKNSPGIIQLLSDQYASRAEDDDLANANGNSKLNNRKLQQRGKDNTITNYGISSVKN